MEETVEVMIDIRVYGILERLGRKTGKTPSEIASEILEKAVEQLIEAKPSNRPVHLTLKK